MNVIVEISARHLHLSQEHLDILYGAGYKLTPKKDLSQPGQFACAEKVEVIGPKGSMKMSILGPVRPATQVEISLTPAPWASRFPSVKAAWWPAPAPASWLAPAAKWTWPKASWLPSAICTSSPRMLPRSA